MKSLLDVFDTQIDDLTRGLNPTDMITVKKPLLNPIDAGHLKGGILAYIIASGSSSLLATALPLATRGLAGVK